MKKLLISLVFVVVAINIANSQPTKPPPPIFDYLTINPTTGNPTLFWTAPAIQPVFNPTGYIIYKITGGIRIAIDTVNNTTFTYTDFNSVSDISKLTYTLASRGTNEPSQLTTDHSNIFVSSTYDSCNRKIVLEWTLYQGWNNNQIAPNYEVYLGNDPNWATFPLAAQVDRFTGRYTINDVDENQDYYAYVVAKRTDAPYTTYSNLYHIFTKMARHPSYMIVDSIVAEDNGNQLHFTIDPATELSRFKVVRWELSDTSRSIFSAKDTLYRFRNKNTVSFFDQSDNWASRTRSFHYKIDAMNGCVVLAIPEKGDTLFKVVSVSNLPNTIITKVYVKKEKNEITWTPFIDTLRSNYKTNSINYILYRFRYLGDTEIIDEIANTTYDNPLDLYARDNNFKYKNPIGVENSTTFVDDIKGFEWQGYSQIFCYQVEAIERDINGNQVMYSRSRKICTEVVPGVTMPDAIKPNDPTRSLFIPFINFEANYTLFIYNRWGELIFEGQNQGWNGRLANGQFVKEGSYVYRLVVHTLGNRDVIKVGNVTVVY